ncbi:TPA: hypothetical protein DIV49_01235 [Candidatus Saccharibacteria bacterium]|nr:hypothetical protein [Candidatus Saccharibacteria bacterium]HRJ90983.1 hypothetical protein [Candidatus Saccharibacteria bacterium]
MKRKVFSLAIILVSAASVAYAAYAQTLTINGTGTATGNWDIMIQSITPTGQVGATDQVGTPSFTATSATFDVEFAYPGSASSYQVVIRNNGNINARLSSITDLTAINAAAPTYITYGITGVAVNDTLAPGATTTATITTGWDSAATTNPNGASKPVTINFNYVQDT